jgi:hypothetical protein
MPTTQLIRKEIPKNIIHIDMADQTRKEKREFLLSLSAPQLDNSEKLYNNTPMWSF